MGLFGALIKTAINIVTLPVDIIKDIHTFGGAMTDQPKTYTEQKLEKIKEEASDD